VYVGDTGSEKVLRFDFDGSLIETFNRPNSIIFGNTIFKPSRLAVDNRGNIYLQSDGVSSGIIQLANNGDFLGYFTSNQVRLNATQQFLKLIFTEEQFNSIANRDPSAFSSVFVDHNSIVYTTTMGTYFNAVKKHNTAGNNMYQDRVISSNDARDITVGKDGIVYAAMNYGGIFVYSSDGEFIYNFGANSNRGTTSNADISGLFSSLSSIALDEAGHIWALDDSKNFLQVFAPTDFALSIYEALQLYDSRNYDEAILIWQEVLKLNQMSVIAHNNIGKNFLLKEQYDQAMIHFQLAGNRDSFSEAFWEVRNTNIQTYFGLFLLFSLGYVVMVIVIQWMRKRTSLLIPVQHTLNQVSSYGLIKDLVTAWKTMTQPVDQFEQIKMKKRGSYGAAFILIVLLFSAYVFNITSKSFIFQFTPVEDLDFIAIIIGFFSLFGAVIISNFLDTSINDGEGDFRSIIMLFSFSVMPAIIGLVFSTFLSYVLTYNEIFFLDLIQNGSIVYSGILVLIGMVEIHNYTLKQLMKSVTVTLMFLLVFITVLLLMTLVWEQVFSFIADLIGEMVRNVTQN
jgi:tetratricopeptide (TPR) repeat protein